MNLADVKFACLDTETTGLSPQGGGKICEIAVCVSCGGQPLEEYTTLINPDMPMHPDVIAIHGITNEMVKDAPLFKDVLPQLKELFEGCVLVAHNADFDIGFLKSEFEQCGEKFPDYPVIDTLKLARKSGLFERNRLGHIVEQLGLSNEGWHRAMADTKMGEQVLYHFLNILHARGITTLEQLTACQFTKWKDLAINKEINV